MARSTDLDLAQQEADAVERKAGDDEEEDVPSLLQLQFVFIELSLPLASNFASRPFLTANS